MFKVPFEVIMRRAKENCERDGKEWKVAVRKANGKFDKKPNPGISESRNEHTSWTTSSKFSVK